MAYLITSDEQLRSFIPNTLQTVVGEASLFDKIHPFINLAEQWLTENFIAPTSLNTLPDMEERQKALDLARQVVVADAFLQAIPSLDLVLTPNGFGIVNNANIAPASKDRVDRLIASLVTLRDRSLDLLLPYLPYCNGMNWYKSDQGLYFLQTLFPRFDLVELMQSRAGTSVWEQYQRWHDALIRIEDELADKFISLPLYDRLRHKQLHHDTNRLEHDVISRLRSVEIELLKGNPFPYESVISLVNFIRKNPDEFPEWPSSTTAQLYEQQSFSNEKNSTGYWW